MTTLLTLVGLSAVGKKGLIRRLLHPAGAPYRRRFGLGPHAEAFGPSFAPVPGSRDPDALRGAILASAAPERILQWQNDLDGVLADLLAARPGWRHRAVVLYRPPERHLVDTLLYRPGLHPPGSIDVAGLVRRWARVDGMLAAHEAHGLVVEVVDASSDSYPPLGRGVLAPPREAA